MSTPIKSIRFSERPQTAPSKTPENKKPFSGTLNHVDIKKFLAGNPIPTEKAAKLPSHKSTPPPTARPQSPSTTPKEDS